MSTQTRYVVQYQDDFSGLLWRDIDGELRSVSEAHKELQQWIQEYPEDKVRVIELTESVHWSSEECDHPVKCCVWHGTHAESVHLGCFLR